MVTKSKRTAIDKYDSKTYHKVTIKLRKEEDAEIIRDMDDALENGISRREWLSGIYEVYKANK